MAACETVKVMRKGVETIINKEDLQKDDKPVTVKPVKESKKKADK